VGRLRTSPPLIEGFYQELSKLKNDLSVNGSLYTQAEQRALQELAEDIVSITKMNLNYGNAAP
jgi:hypothetical protein